VILSSGGERAPGDVEGAVPATGTMGGVADHGAAGRADEIEHAGHDVATCVLASRPDLPCLPEEGDDALRARDGNDGGAHPCLEASHEGEEQTR
jgi:hypothetical protein